MKLSKTSEYALRILIYMAKEPNQLYTASQLVKELGVSDKYLRRLMTDLSKAGFIKSVQGRDGGYTFMKSTNEIFLFDVIDSVEGMGNTTYRDWETDRKSTRLNSSHRSLSRMPSSA